MLALISSELVVTLSWTFSIGSYFKRLSCLIPSLIINTVSDFDGLDVVYVLVYESSFPISAFPPSTSLAMYFYVQVWLWQEPPGLKTKKLSENFLVSFKQMRCADPQDKRKAKLVQAGRQHPSILWW